MNNKYVSLICGGLLAGICIGIGARINANIGGVAGAVLFSCGLVCVVHNKIPLFTGRIGFLNYGVFSFLLMLCANVAGAMLVALPGSFTFTLPSMELQNVFLGGLICGACMQLAVDGPQSDLRVVLCVAAFILGGGRHCIADAAYMAMSHSFDVLWIAVAACANGVGAIIVRFLKGGKFHENPQ